MVIVRVVLINDALNATLQDLQPLFVKSHTEEPQKPILFYWYQYILIFSINSSIAFTFLDCNNGSYAGQNAVRFEIARSPCKRPNATSSSLTKSKVCPSFHQWGQEIEPELNSCFLPALMICKSSELKSLPNTTDTTAPFQVRSFIDHTVQYTHEALSACLTEPGISRASLYQRVTGGMPRRYLSAIVMYLHSTLSKERSHVPCPGNLYMTARREVF